MQNQPVQVTKDGLKALKKELKELKKIKRPHLVARLANARSEGDLKENSDYHNAKDELGFLDGRIDELEHVVKNAQVMNGTASKGNVGVGTKVKLKVAGKEIMFFIVGEWEADPMQKKISHTSPLGRALTGRKVGDKVEVEAPVGRVVYEILSVE